MTEADIFINRMRSVVDCHRGTINYVAVLGCLELLKAEIINETPTKDHEDRGVFDD